MRHILFLLFMAFTLQAIAQYPATGNKMRLGWQTTGDGLVYRGAIGDTATLDPSGINNAWMLLDTANGNLYAYRAKAWRLVSGGGGGGGLTMPFDSVTFNVNETDASLRELKYSEEKGYLQYGGQDSVQIPILPGIWYVRNDTSVTIPKGTVLRATGTLGASGRIKVKHMIANGSIDAMYILGIAMQDIAVGADGYAMSQGKIRKINTQAYSEGAVLYADVDTLGGLTQTEPTGSNLKLPIAFVVNSASNGTIAVRVTSGAYMRDLHDAEITSPVSNASLYYNAAQGVWRDTGAAVLVADTAAMLTNYINVADTATMLSSYISNADTSVFARDFQISGTTNYLAKFTGSNAVGNSGVFESGGNVGIGTASPTAKFDLRGGIYQQDGDVRLAVSSGNVGISTGGAPESKLHLGSGGLMIDGPGTLDPYLDFRINTVKIWTIGVDNSDSDKFKIADGGGTNNLGSGDKFTIDGSGNVGIATASPSRPLHINATSAIRLPVGNFAERGTSGAGDIRVRNDTANLEFHNGTGWQTVINNSDTSVFARDVQISGTTNRLAMFTGSNAVGNSAIDVTSDTVSIRDYSNSYTTWRFHSNINKRGFIGYPAGTRFYSLVNPSAYAGFMYGDRSAGALDQQAFTQLTAWNGGGAASGFFSAATTLNGADSTLYFNISGLSANADPTFPAAQMVIQKGGNVGIATSSPSRPLHVAQTTAIRIPSGNFSQRGTSDNGDIRVRTDTASMEYYSGAWRTVAPMARVPQSGLANRFSKFAANGLLDTSAVLIQNGSNIGIGTSSATNLLTIKSQSTSDIPVSVRSSAASNINIVALSESNGAGAISLKDKNGNTDIVLNTDITAFNISNDTTPPYIIATSYSPTSGNGPEINLSRARGTEASPSAVSNGDELGEINFSGRSTSGGQTTAAIRALADSVVTSRLNTGLAFYTGATTATLTERMRINSKGNVGIGTASPTAKLHIRDSTVSGLEINNPSADGRALALASNNTGNYIGFQMGGSNFILPNTAYFYTQGASVVGFYLATNGETPTGGNTPIYLQTGGYYNTPTLTARPGDPGEVSVGGVADNGAFNLQCNGTGVWGAGAYVNGSDARIKENINDIGSSLNTVMKLKPVTFKYIESFSKDRAVQTGFIAQDLLSALEGKDYINGIVNQGGEYLSVAYQNLIPLLTKAIQEQQAQIEALKKEIEALKNK